MSDISKLRMPTEKGIIDDLMADAGKHGIEIETGSADHSLVAAAAARIRRLYLDLMRMHGIEPNPDDISADGRTQGVRAI